MSLSLSLTLLELLDYSSLVKFLDVLLVEFQVVFLQCFRLTLAILFHFEHLKMDCLRIIQLTESELLLDLINYMNMIKIADCFEAELEENVKWDNQVIVFHSMILVDCNQLLLHSLELCKKEGQLFQITFHL